MDLFINRIILIIWKRTPSVFDYCRRKPINRDTGNSIGVRLLLKNFKKIVMKSGKYTQLYIQLIFAVKFREAII